MPCIVMYTNMEVPKEKAEELKKALVVSWEKLPGKSERWLMTTIRDNTTMFFGGKIPLRPLSTSRFSAALAGRTARS